MNNYSEPVRSEVGHPRRWTILWILCGSLVLVVISVSSLNVALPPIQRGLGASGSELQWIVDSYALVFAGLLLPAGALGDRFGRREALLAGLVVFGLAALGGMQAGSATELIVWRGLMGAGAALIMPATLSIVATVFGPQERSRAIAIWAGFAGAGGVVGLVASGLLLERFWWGSIFAVNLPVVVIMIVAVVAVVPTSRDEAATPLDPVGAVLSIVGLSAVVFGIIEGPEKGWTSAITLTSFVVALVALAGFVVWELRSSHPMLDPQFFLDRRFSLGSVTITAAFFGIFGMFFVVAQFLQFVQAHDPLAAGLRILPYGVVLLVVAPKAAPLADRHGARAVTVVGIAVAVVGMITLGLLQPDSSYAVTLVGLVFVALGTGLLMPPATTAIVVSLPSEKAGVGSAMNDATREVGGAIGIAVVGALLSIGYRSSLGDAVDATGAVDGEAAHLAEDSIGGLLTVADGLPADAASPLVAAGRQAFTDGMRLGMLGAAVLLAAAGVLVSVFLPAAETDDTTAEVSEREGADRR